MTVYTSSITNALYTIISSDQTLIDSGTWTELYPVDNTNPNDNPWVGIYQPVIEINPNRSNITMPWMATLSIPVKLKITYANDTTTAQQLLDDLTNRVFTTVYSSRSLMNTVENLIGWEIAPFERNDGDEDYMYYNLMNIIVEVFA